MPNKKSAVSTPKNTTLKTLSPDAALVRALAEKLKQWMEEDLPFLGVATDDISIKLDSSETYAECKFSTDACNHTVLVYNDFSLRGFAEVTDSILCCVFPEKADEDWVFDDTGPFCEDAWRNLLLAIIGVEKEVASEKATALRGLQILQQRLEKTEFAATEAVPA